MDYIVHGVAKSQKESQRGSFTSPGGAQSKGLPLGHPGSKPFSCPYSLPQVEGMGCEGLLA